MRATTTLKRMRWRKRKSLQEILAMIATIVMEKIIWPKSVCIEEWVKRRWKKTMKPIIFEIYKRFERKRLLIVLNLLRLCGRMLMSLDVLKFYQQIQKRRKFVSPHMVDASLWSLESRSTREDVWYSVVTFPSRENTSLTVQRPLTAVLLQDLFRNRWTNVRESSVRYNLLSSLLIFHLLVRNLN